ncbi:MAG TPA: alkaline phosphatase family protein, partial [Pseudomonadales bacterium]|nr:alkaline phosphatase family protein [Pseudomonadales bacterium]
MTFKPFAIAMTVTLGGCNSAQPVTLPIVSGKTDPLKKIDHIVVIVEENRSFDSLFGYFPGANGLANAGE